MAKERAFSYRNTAAQGEAPVWEKWFMKTVADAVMMSDGDDEDENIVQYVERKIDELIGGAPGTYDTLKEIADYIAEHEDVTEALNEAITSKADKTAATTTAAGLMSAADKTKLDGVETGANKYTHPTTSGNKHIPTGGATGKILGWKADGEAQWVDDKNTTYSAFKGATSAAAGGTGLVPAPAAGDQAKFLSGDGTWDSVNDMAPTFTQAETRANIASGEKVPTLFGKIAKWFTDLKTGAFATVVNNLTTTAASTVLDGRQGKALNDKITAINSALVTVRTVNEWTMIEYPNNLIEAWRYATLSSTSEAKTNTLTLPTPMKDSEYGVKISPVFNGHLCHAVWAGSKTGADGRTKTAVQISMDSTDSDSNVGVFVFISGYRQ